MMAFLFAFVLIVVVLAATVARRRRVPSSLAAGNDAKLSVSAEDEKRGESNTTVKSPEIEPLPDFDWQATPPTQLRPFRPTYNITMGMCYHKASCALQPDTLTQRPLAIQGSTPSDLITIDSNYLSRITARRELIASHPSTVHGAIPSGHAPVLETYTYLLGTYLPTRFPTLFTLIPSSSSSANPSGTLFLNKATNQTFPLHPPPSDPAAMLRILGETVEDDMFLLLQDDAAQGGEHRAVAFVCCHPAGFDPSSKLGKRLAEIHGPVPAYEKIGASMERYFGRLEVGRGVKRMNVSSFFSLVYHLLGCPFCHAWYS